MPSTRTPGAAEAVPPHILAVLAVITSAAFIQDRQGRYLDCNKAFELFLNLPKTAIIGKSAADIYPRTLAHRCLAEDRQVIDRREPCRFPVAFKGLNGRLVDAEIIKIPLLDGLGEVAGILGVFSEVSQSKLYNETLLRYELLLRYSGDFIWIADPQTGRILEVNEAACKAYGYSRQEFQNLTVHDLRADDPAVIDRQIAGALKNGLLLETVHRRKDGTTFPVQVNASGATVGGREILASIVRDMAETVRTREALRKQNEYLSMLHRTALSLIDRLDIDELFEQIIARAATLAGSDNAFIFLLDDDGRTFSIKAGTGVCADHLGAKFSVDVGLGARVIATGEAILINNYKTWPHRTDDPRLGPIEAMLAVPLLAAGKVVGLIGFIAVDPQIKFTKEDLVIVKEFANLASLALGNASLYTAAQAEIRERRGAEEEIRKLSQAVDQSPGMVIITDPDGYITYVNAKFTQVYGYTLREVSGMTPRVLKSGAQDASFYRNLWETIRGGREWKGELCNHRKNKELLWVLAAISPVRNLEGNVAYYLAVQQDMTEQKAIEATLQRQNLEIQTTLTKLQQTQTQLIQQEKMAGIGQLAAGVAHEINNPLGFVHSNFETLQKYMGRLAEMVNAYRDLHRLVKQANIAELKTVGEQIDDLEKKYKLDYIMGDLGPIFTETGEGISRMENIVKALCLFSRVDQQDSFQDFDLNAGLRSTLTVARNEIKYIADVEEDLGDIPVIEAMGGKLNQVLLNIVMNAAQAIKSWHSGPHGLIKIRSRADDEFVYCDIEDNGSGIPDEIRQDIFNPFFTTKPVGEGTGLGLSISYDIVINKHHGDIIVASKLHSGTTFTIKLPIKQPRSKE